MEQTIKFPKIDFDGVKAVLIDLDNTLYHYDSCHSKAIAACHYSYVQDVDKDISLNDFSTFYREKRDLVVKRLSPQGACRSRLFAFQAMFEESNLDRNWELAEKYNQIYWSSIIDNMKIANDALIFLQKCKDLNIDICVVSDMIANIQVMKLQKLGVAKYIKYLVTSEEVGAEKPSSMMFETALRKLNVKPEHAIMIGDSVSKDIKGAEALGIKSYKVLIKNLWY